MTNGNGRGNNMSTIKWFISFTAANGAEAQISGEDSALAAVERAFRRAGI